MLHDPDMVYFGEHQRLVDKHKCSTITSGHYSYYTHTDQ